MQLCKLTLRLGGSLLHTVPKTGVTPAEILILRRIHGDDACVDIIPTKVDKRIRQEEEWERLSNSYDQAGGLQAAPGDEHKSIMAAMFPGAMKKLPTTLKEIGLGHLTSTASISAAEKGSGAAAIADPHAEEEAVLTDNDEDDDGHDDDTGEFVEGNVEGAKPLDEPVKKNGK